MKPCSLHGAGVVEGTLEVPISSQEMQAWHKTPEMHSLYLAGEVWESWPRKLERMSWSCPSLTVAIQRVGPAHHLGSTVELAQIAWVWGMEIWGCECRRAVPAPCLCKVEELTLVARDQECEWDTNSTPPMPRYKTLNWPRPASTPSRNWWSSWWGSSYSNNIGGSPRHRKTTS